MKGKDKPLVWLHGEIRTPPLSSAARTETGFLLRRLQKGELLSMPHSRPMPAKRHPGMSLRDVSGGFDFMIPPQEKAHEEHKEKKT